MVRYFSVITYHTDTEGKLGQYFQYQNFWREPLKNWWEPPFSKEGGLRPPFCALRPPFEGKKEFPRNFSKKEFPAKSSKGVPAKAYSTKIRTENTDTGCI